MTVDVEVSLNSECPDGAKHGHCMKDHDGSYNTHKKICLEGPGFEAKRRTTSGLPAPSLGHHDVHHSKVSRIKVPTKKEPDCVPCNHDTTSGLVVLIIVLESGKSPSDLTKTHPGDTHITLANSVGSLGTSALAGKDSKGSLTGT